ncbi:MAG: beta-lactamase hydrolase domain-containing protein [Planctomycetota bacterium]
MHTLDDVYLASQPAAADFEQAAANGIRTILNLREDGEVTEFDEPALIAKLRMNYVSLPFKGPGALSDEILDRARALLRDREKRPILIHCSSGNRVGAIWFAHRSLDAGLSWEAALEEARTVGLKTPALEARVKAYCERARVGAGGP